MKINDYFSNSVLFNLLIRVLIDFGKFLTITKKISKPFFTGGVLSFYEI